jgi:N,N'-diacetyllegionaminate synthase
MNNKKKTFSTKKGFGKIPKEHTYFIAEAGNNHNGDVEIAKKMIDLAVDCGADAIKFQKRDIDSMLTAAYLDQPCPILSNEGENFSRTYRKVREAIELDIDEFSTLKDYCKNRIDFIVTPFDLISLENLEKIDVDAYKIAAFTVTDTPVLEVLANTEKTVFMSLGMSTEEEILNAVEILKNTDLVLMHCVSSYPMKVQDANLNLIDWIRSLGYPVGWSDHENGITLAPVTVALGVRCIEKHFTLDRSMKGFDHAMSLEPTGLRKVIRDIRKVEVALQGLKNKREILSCELSCYHNKRKSIVATQHIKKGEKITRDMLTTKGPNKGLSPAMIPRIIGKIALEDIKADTHVTFSMVEL